MSTKNGKKKKTSITMDSNGRLIKGKKVRNGANGSKNIARTPPKYGKTGVNSQGSMSHGPYNPVSNKSTTTNGGGKITSIINSSGGKQNTTQKSSVLRFDQPTKLAMNVPPTILENKKQNNNNNHTEDMSNDQIASNITFKKPSISLRNLLNKNPQQIYYSNSTPSSPTPSSSNNKQTKLGSIDIIQQTSYNQNTQKHIIFAQLKRKRKNTANNNNNSSSNGHSSSSSNNNDTKAARPTFQFKIGMQVGVALGDCFLQLQKLENSMDKLRNVSEDITDVMQCIEQMGGTEEIKQRNRKKSESKQNNIVDEEDPIEEVHVLNDNLLKWQKDASKRMKNVSVTVTKLQTKLEDLDEYHAQAQSISVERQRHDKTEVDKAMETIKKLENEIQKTKLELSQKNIVMQQLSKTKSEPSNHELIREKLEKLESKEKELDRDAEIIATQSEELRKESERLLTERDEVRKQKEQWQKMIDEVKEQKAKLEKRESELQANHKKLLELHETLSEEKKKLHKKAKKIKAREKRLNALRAAQSQYVQQQNSYQVPSSNGSDYAESELTYFSDGDTEIASVNSISDDESQDNYHKQQLKAIAHLGVPQNPMF